MSIAGSAIGAGLKVGGGIFGGVSASKAMRKVIDSIKKQQKENENWYNRRYYEDATQRADAQHILTQTQDSIRKSNQAAAASAAVAGGTDESMAAAREAGNRALADATSRIAVAGEARKDDIEQQYLNNKANLNQQLNNARVGKANAIASAVNGVANTGADIANMWNEED